jgi:DnaJ-class molecular chaperone
MTDIVDRTDFCRACRGKGRVTDQVDHGRTRSVPCDECRGTGSKTVRVGVSA